VSLEFHYHPLSSYCWKGLIALYELGTEFTPVNVDLGDPVERAEHLKLSPFGKIPALRDAARGVAVWETSLLIDYLDQHYPGPLKLVPLDRDAAREVALRDRLFDLYVHNVFQRIVAERFRPDDKRDPFGVEQWRAELRQAYDLLERDLAGKTWAAGEDFTLADCAAAPALFYADIIEPIGAGRPALSGYKQRLLERPSVARAIDEAKPSFGYYPATPEERVRLQPWS
jgi:glutathione S-transferase